MMPQRIQRRRVKGWRMPEGAVYVGRPTMWGNPYPFPGEADQFTDDAARRHYAAVRYKALLNSMPHLVDTIRRELGGKDLVCWCPLSEHCHADVLLGIANPLAEIHLVYERSSDG